jgi:S-DNA-T family DNA segregation ATPase FtsK/SpoIIIE
VDLTLIVTAESAVPPTPPGRPAPRPPQFHLRVDIDGQATTGDLLTALSAACSRGVPVSGWNARTRSALAPARPLATSGVRTGDEIVLTHPGAVPSAGATTAPAPTAGWELVVVGGRDTGARLPLLPGRHLLGRDPGPGGLMLADGRASRQHAEVTVTAEPGPGGIPTVTAVTVTDLGATNGTLLDGAPVIGPTPWVPGQILAIGATRIACRAGAAGRPPAALTAADGTLGFSRPPRVRQNQPPVDVRVPVPPRAPGSRRLPLSASLIPVVMGGVMALVMGPVMLLFALMGPVMAGVTMIEDRRSGRRDYLQAKAAFAADMDGLEHQLAVQHAALLADRRAAAPDPAELADRAEQHSASLWERRPADDDFLSLRIGAAALPSRLRLQPVDTETDGAEAQRVAALLARYATDPDAPVDADLRTLGALGVCGEDGAAQAMLRSLVLQAAVLASPRDLAIVALVPAAVTPSWDWVKWLPHTLPLVAGVPGARTVASTEPDVRTVLGLVDDLITTRRLAAERNPGSTPAGSAVLLVIPGPVDLPRPALSRVLADGPGVGVFALVGAPRAEQLPGECRAIVRADDDPGTASVTVTGTGDVISPLLVDRIGVTRATAAARALAPLRDVSAAAATGELPRQVLLLDVLGMPEPDPDAVLARWSRVRRGGDLGAPIGISSAGTAHLDLRRDGPHGLTAGTTGSGKSEFLQSLVASLAASHPASELTFILVDYKGGAAFAGCVGLPHTVGFFTDLDAHLAQRALVSLNAELRRREHILAAAGAKDLIDLERRFPDRAPANLLIVFDEFAFLKKEVPEFVAGVIDIAQRGRSLGVHLMLATQRPSGVVDDNIRANTNLRIALRIADEADSNDVIDRPDAARIPKSLPGRAFLRIGRDVTGVQTAYASARSAHGPTRAPTVVRPLLFEPGLSAPERSAGRGGPAGPDPEASSPTDLQRLVEAIRAAHLRARIPDQPLPWLDPLPDLCSLEPLGAPASGPIGELAAAVGIIDLPDQQAQRPHLVDLTADGHLLLYGAAGSGKTTALRTLAAALAGRLAPDDLQVYALDCAGGGLRSLTALPHCAAVVTPDEAERVDRLFAVLERALAERRAALAAASAASLVEYRATGGRLPYLVVLLDGYAGFHQTYLNVDHGELVDRLARLAADGRAVGIYLVVSADRRNAIPSTLSGVISSRIVLRMAESDEYASLGLPTAIAQSTVPAGRGFTAQGREVQLAVVGDDPSGAGQAAALAALGSTLAASHGGGPRPTAGAPGAPGAAGAVGAVGAVEPLADEVSLAALPAGQPGRVPIGVSGLTDRASWVDLVDTPVFAVLGPDRSGRSTALGTLAAQLVSAQPDLPAFLVSPRRSPLLDQLPWAGIGREADAVPGLLAGAGALLDGARPDGLPSLLVVVDDADELVDTPAATALSALLRRGRDAGLVLLVAAQTHVVHRSFGGFLTDIRKPKHGALLAPDPEVDGELFGARLHRRRSHRFPPGRCYLVRRGDVDYVQIAR